MELRPLRAGEVPKRAVAFYLDNFYTFNAIVLVAIVPLTIATAIALAPLRAHLDTVGAILGPKVTLEDVFGSRTELERMAAVLAAWPILWALAFGAMAIAGALRLRARPAGIAAAYAGAVRRWPATIGTFALVLLAAIAWVFAVSFLVGMVGAIVLAATGDPVASGKAPSSEVAVLAIGVSIAALAVPLLQLGLAFGAFGATLERQSPAAAVGTAVRRIFSRGEFKSAFGLALGVSVGFYVAEQVCGWLAGMAFPGLPVAAEALAALAESVLSSLAIAIVLIYYFDVRARREGFDLLERLESGGDPASDDQRYGATRYLSGGERSLIASFLERRDAFAPAARAGLAARLASDVRPRVPLELQTLDDEALLERL